MASKIRELLEEQTGSLLLIAGSFMMIRLLVKTLSNTLGIGVQEQLPGWVAVISPIRLFGLIGLALPFIVLTGLYYQVNSKTPRLAAVGGALMGFTPVLFLAGLLTLLVGPLPRSPYLLWLSPLPYVVGAGCFGLAFFWKDGSIRFAGIPLLIFSGTWILAYAVGLYSGTLQGQFPFVELLAVSLVAMGYILYTGTPTQHSAFTTGS